MRTHLARIAIVLALGIGTLASLAHAQSPLPLNVPFPGQNQPIPSGSGTITAYIEQLYRFSLILGTFLAMLMIAWGAIQYAASTGNTSVKHDAQERIKGAILGLILLLAVVLIFRTLNPNIVATGRSGSGGQGGGQTRMPDLSVPTSVSIALLSNGNYQFRWTDSSADEDEFLIEVRKSDGSLLETLRYGGVSGTGSLVGYDITPRPGADNFRVAAAQTATQTSPQNVGQFSNTVAAPQAPISNTLGAPQIVAVERPSQNTLVNVRWEDRSTNESGFLIQGLTARQTSPAPGGTGPPSPTDWITVAQYPAAQTPQGSAFSVLQTQFNQAQSNGAVITRVRIAAFRSENNQIVEQALSGEATVPVLSFSLNDPGSNPQLTNITLEQTALAGPAIVVRWLDNSNDETRFVIYASGAPLTLTSPGFFRTPVGSVSANGTVLSIPLSSLSASPGNIPASTIQGILQSGGQITIEVTAVGQGANPPQIPSNPVTITIPPQSSTP